MNHNAILIIVLIIAVVAVVLAVVFVIRKRRSQQLRERFGPEYERVVRQEGDVRKAEQVLDFREKRREKFELHALSPADKSRFEKEWTEVQSRFVDDPKRVVGLADSLVDRVMRERGYPMGEFDQRAADISVDYPVVVENYRAAHDIALRRSRGQVSTEDLRKAMVHYRTLFQQLLDQQELQRKEA